jgi:2-haloacid dehalogenase
MRTAPYSTSILLSRMLGVSKETSAPFRYCGGSYSSNIPGCGLSWSDTRTFGVSQKPRYDRPPRQLQIAIDETHLDRLMKAYLCPAAFEDVKPALRSLRGVPLAILSNGSLKMLEAAVHHNGLEPLFTEIISVDRARIYKPSPRAYSLGTESLRLPASEILFVSSNSWDGSGAKAFGYTVCQCNRQNQKTEFLEGAPDLTVTRLDQIANLIG